MILGLGARLESHGDLFPGRELPENLPCVCASSKNNQELEQQLEQESTIRATVAELDQQREQERTLQIPFARHS